MYTIKIGQAAEAVLRASKPSTPALSLLPILLDTECCDSVGIAESLVITSALCRASKNYVLVIGNQGVRYRARYIGSLRQFHIPEEGFRSRGGGGGGGKGTIDCLTWPCFWQVVEKAAALLEHKVPQIRARACNVVGNLCRHSNHIYPILRQARVLPALLACLVDNDTTVRKFACFSVGNAAFHDASLYQDLKYGDDV